MSAGMGVMCEYVEVELRIIFCMLALGPATSNAFEICQQFREFESEWNAESPQLIDAHTELIQAIVNCDAEVVLYRKRVLGPGSVLPSDVFERKQRQHT